jgi:DNA-directed RNA polymerase specialized sigma24 family protein
MQFIRYHEVDPLLVERAQAGDKKATNELIVQLLPLVGSMAGKQYWKLNKRTVSMISEEDLVQEGVLAIYTALKHFNKARSDKFHMYVQYVISSKMKDFMKSYVEKNKDYVTEHEASALTGNSRFEGNSRSEGPDMGGGFGRRRDPKSELKILEELECNDTEPDPFIKKRIRRATRRMGRDE